MSKKIIKACVDRVLSAERLLQAAENALKRIRPTHRRSAFRRVWEQLPYHLLLWR